MPVNVTYPGVYVDEVKSSVRTITGVPTSVAAFVGYAPRGPADRPVHITGWADYEAVFGGLQANCPMSYAVYQFYLNGGSEAEIVRVVGDGEDAVELPLASGPPTRESNRPSPAAPPAAAGAGEGGEAAAPASASGENSAPEDKNKKRGGGDAGGGSTKATPPVQPAEDSSSAPVLIAASPGRWGRNLRARVDYETSEKADPPPSPLTLFNLTVHDTETGAEERYLNISVEADSPRSLKHLLESSQLVRLKAPFSSLPKPTDTPDKGDPFKTKPEEWPQGKTYYYVPTDSRAGADAAPGLDDYRGDPAKKTGLYQLLKTDIFNILCLPDTERMGDQAAAALRPEALKLCLDRRALLLVDPPASWTGDLDSVLGKLADVQGDEADKNAALYYPRILAPDPLLGGAVRPFPPCGVMAGVLARTDVQRGVWKAPAGTDASLSGVSDLEVPLTDLEIGRLNPVGVNCLRRLPAAGPVAWGARTLRGSDRLADEWKYLPVRRLALFIEESLFRGTQWVVFEPNDEPLWASVRLNVGAFMNSLFRAGAFQGRTPQEAYLVKCDKDTNPQNDIDRGIVNIHVGFAPLKPAEFVIVHIQQLAGQIQV
ncbi:phage tail sheath family protein [Streptomyces sp. ME18-1-4]|uniref:phage tail sheath family protein n=1 Tax=Streptomyces sp. ME18-1-4 TaxID=3028685 RepID=UPI0029B8AB5F|nr:phage tail sheath C-terminal domain-containing protein [Streptomyces sp. ME18-1-4]MDX3247028.1 phage tail sheath subtilisin-like domain-containing protein [Streptomyces sp. ME18-1-4]